MDNNLGKRFVISGSFNESDNFFKFMKGLEPTSYDIICTTYKTAKLSPTNKLKFEVTCKLTDESLLDINRTPYWSLSNKDRRNILFKSTYHKIDIAEYKWIVSLEDNKRNIINNNYLKY